MLVELDDEGLMVLVIAGNHDAFAEIVSRHTPKFFALAFRTLQNQSDAEDIVQAALIKLWQKPTAWNKNKAKFTTWFYRVVLNACHDFTRKHGRVSQFDHQSLEALSRPTADEQDRLEQVQQEYTQKYCLMVAIERLPSSQRDALNLVVYSEMPQRQAAEVLGISVKALESLLVRAKRSIRKTVNEIEATGSQPILPLQTGGKK